MIAPPARSGRPLTPYTNAIPDRPPYSITSHTPSRVVDVAEAIARHAVGAGDGCIGGPCQPQIPPSRNPLFTHVPANGLVYVHQNGYYHAIRRSSADGESASFVASILDMILQDLRLPAVVPR